jgi:hypothetical protein
MCSSERASLAADGSLATMLRIAPGARRAIEGDCAG